MMDDTTSNSSARPLSRPDVVLFSVQVMMIFIVVCTSLFNISFQKENINLWTIILTSCLGYLMPNPKFKLNAIKEEAETLGNRKNGVGIVLHDSSL